MRQKIRLWIRLPKRLSNAPPWKEAEYYARLYKRAKNNKECQKVYESLLVNGGNWDIISRSCCYLNIFEQKVGKKFDFWR
jgi:hypothetical protein